MVGPEAAEVVKRIFAMTIDGYGPYHRTDRKFYECVLASVLSPERSVTEARAVID